MVGSYFQKYIRQCPSFAQNSPLAPLFIKKNTSLSRSFLFDSPFPTPNCLFIFIYFMLPFVEPPVVMLIIRCFSSLPVYLHFGDLNTCLPSAGSSWSSMIPSFLLLNLGLMLPSLCCLPWPDRLESQLVHSNTRTSQILSSFFSFVLQLALSNMLIFSLPQSQIILFNIYWIYLKKDLAYIKCQ